MARLDDAIVAIANSLNSAIKNGRLQMGSVAGNDVVDAVYDFAVQGGAIGTITLPVQIPAKAIVIGGFLDVITAPTSGGSATVAINVEGAADVQAPTAIASLTTGRKALIPVFTAASSVKTTIQRNVTVTIATAALTAGKFHIVLYYTVTE